MSQNQHPPTNDTLSQIIFSLTLQPLDQNNVWLFDDSWQNKRDINHNECLTGNVLDEYFISV